MPQRRGEITEIWFEPGEDNRPLIAGRITCPAGLLPAPGQYLLAHPPELPAAPLPVALFASRVEAGTLIAAPPLPAAWLPGMRLDLRGPLGQGFRLPAGVRRLALVAAGAPHRLLPLVVDALAQGSAAVLFCDAPLPDGLPTALEVAPLSELEANRDWPDFVAVDLDFTPENYFTTEPTETDKNKRERGGGTTEITESTENKREKENSEKNSNHQKKSVFSMASVVNSLKSLSLSCPGQVLIYRPMPCGGVAECGACAVRTRKGWKLACKDGPVFDLSEMEFNS